MKLELGINTCFAVKRWPLPADWAPIVSDRLKLRLVEHSLDLVDLSSAEAHAEAVNAAARYFDLRIGSVFTGLAAYSSNLLLAPDGAERARAWEFFGRAIEFSATVGSSAIGGHVGAFSVAEWLDATRRSERWEDLREALHQLAGRAHDRGQRALMIENLAAAREPSTMVMVKDLVTDGDSTHAPIRLALDVGHMCVAGTSGADRDPYAWLREMGRAAHEVQLQQSDTEGDHHWPFTPEANRRGRIDADRVIDALGDAGVEEMALILEIIPAFEQDDAAVLDDLAASVDYWLEALTRTGTLAG
jgi:sugar phosphate isomerase/epimerase